MVLEHLCPRAHRPRAARPKPRAAGAFKAIFSFIFAWLELGKKICQSNVATAETMGFRFTRSEVGEGPIGRAKVTQLLPGLTFGAKPRPVTPSYTTRATSPVATRPGSQPSREKSGHRARRFMASSACTSVQLNFAHCNSSKTEERPTIFEVIIVIYVENWV